MHGRSVMLQITDRVTTAGIDTFTTTVSSRQRVSAPCSQASKLAHNADAVDYVDQSTNGWLAWSARRLYSTDGVESVHVTVEEGVVHIWVLISERDMSVLRGIAQTESDVVDLVASSQQPFFLVDIHVVYRNSRPVENLLPTGAIYVPRKT